MIEYWIGSSYEYKFFKNVNWEYKIDIDLYEFVKCKVYLISICFLFDGKKIVIIGLDRKVRIFRFLIGKFMRVFDELLSVSVIKLDFIFLIVFMFCCFIKDIFLYRYILMIIFFYYIKDRI